MTGDRLAALRSVLSCSECGQRRHRDEATAFLTHFICREFNLVTRERFVAVALLTNSELQGIGEALHCVLPIEAVPEEFQELLAKIDAAEERRTGL